MELPKRWMLATDGSKYANLSVEYAAQLYKFMDPKPDVLIINVIPEPGKSAGKETDIAVIKEKERGKQILREAVQRFIDASGSAETVRTMVAMGESREVIVKIAEGNKTDHIIMGGADFRWTDVISGGVSNYVLHHAKCLVTLIK
ncbi:MAG: universal stress protein [Cyclonatronaceae bacterium]